MHKFSKLAAGSAILATAALATAGTALADGYAPKGRVVYERPTDWSGVYFGVGSGYAWSGVEVTNQIGIDSSHSDGFASAHIGAQHQFGNIVLGVEGGWMSSIRDRDGTGEFCDSVLPSLTNPMITPGNFCHARLNDILTIGGRVGWAAGHWMPYVTGGYANGAFEFKTAVPAVVEQAQARLGGWYIGGGVEWKISPGWTAGLEYRHYDFNENTVTAFTPAGAFLERTRFDASTDTVSARVSWSFYRPEARPLK